MNDLRKKIRFLVHMCMIGSLLPGCNQRFEQSDSGLWVRFIEKGPGPKPQKGEFLILDLLIKTKSDSIIFSTTQNEIYFPVRYDPYKQKIGLDNILDEGFYRLEMGDSVVFKLRAKELYSAGLNVNRAIMPDRIIVVHTRVVDIYTYEEYTLWKKKEFIRRKEKLNRDSDEMLQQQIAEIESSLQSQKIKYSGTASGIRYILTRPGQGRYPEEGDSVSFSYEVTYFDGAEIDGSIASSGGTPKSIMLGTTGVFESWQESIKLLKQGGKGLFYIPSPLAFGTSGAYGIKPNSILIVEMELVSVKKNSSK